MADVNIKKLYNSIDSFMPVYFKYINPIIHQMETPDGMLNENHLKVLMALEKKSRISSAEISKLFMIPKTSLTTIVRALENRGLIVRNVENNDRRRSVLTLSSKGKALVKKKRSKNISSLRTLFTGIKPDEALYIIRGFLAMEQFFGRKGFDL
jgi:DNA-binding MarR family transcriptional regulator